MSDYSIDAVLQEVQLDGRLNQLVRSSDPYLKKMAEEEVRTRVGGRARPFHFDIPEADLKRYISTYGEQYVSNPCTDLDQYFDIINRRFPSRTVPTQLAVLYLFGSGKQYRPSVASLSAAGEGVAGYCMEKFGYRALVRPLGIMPDAVLWTRRSGKFLLALAESKASTSTDPAALLDKCVFQFLVDIKTRATGFRFDYEGYLVCSRFQDKRHVDCLILRVDLGAHPASETAPPPKVDLGTVPTYEDPEGRLEAIIRVQAETSDVNDEYLTGVLSEEASRSATLALIKKGVPPEQISQVDAYISQKSQALGLSAQWEAGQRTIRSTKKAEQEKLTTAIQRYKKPDTSFEN